MKNTEKNEWGLEMIQHNEGERIRENMIKRNVIRKINNYYIQAHNLRQKNKKRSLKLANLKWKEDEEKRKENKIEIRLHQLEKEKKKLEKEKEKHRLESQAIQHKRQEIKKNALKLNFALTNEKNVCVSEDELRTGMVFLSNETKKLIKLKIASREQERR